VGKATDERVLITVELLFWLSGLSLVLGGALATAGWLLFALLDPAHRKTENDRWLVLNALIIAGGVFMALGLPGFYARQAEEAGIIGLLGFVILFIGIIIPYVAVHSIETVTAPNTAPRMRLWVAVGAPSVLFGILFTGVATWRADVYPQAAGVLLLVSALVGLFTTVVRVPPSLRRNVFPAALTIIMAWLGFLLMGR